MDEQATIETDGPAGTARVASALAGHLAAGDAVLLTGELAAGKTTFVTALVGALGSAAAVTSPTFSLAQFYDTAGPRVLHVDTYRLDDVAAFHDLGLEEYLEEVVALIEWGALVAGDFPDALRVHLAGSGPTSTGRTITITGGPRWAPVVAALGVPA